MKHKYQSTISPGQSLTLIQKLKEFDGAIDYDGDCSCQVYFKLKNGKRLRFAVCDGDVGNPCLAIDQYPGLAIVGASGETVFL